MAPGCPGGLEASRAPHLLSTQHGRPRRARQRESPAQCSGTKAKRGSKARRKHCSSMKPNLLSERVQARMKKCRQCSSIQYSADPGQQSTGTPVLPGQADYCCKA